MAPACTAGSRTLRLLLAPLFHHILYIPPPFVRLRSLTSCPCANCPLSFSAMLFHALGVIYTDNTNLRNYCMVTPREQQGNDCPALQFNNAECSPKKVAMFNPIGSLVHGESPLFIPAHGFSRARRFHPVGLFFPATVSCTQRHARKL